jgi:hypothetical protein
MFYKSSHEISRKSAQELRSKPRTDGRADMTKLTNGFLDHGNAPKEKFKCRPRAARPGASDCTADYILTKFTARVLYTTLSIECRFHENPLTVSHVRISWPIWIWVRSGITAVHRTQVVRTCAQGRGAMGGNKLTCTRGVPWNRVAIWKHRKRHWSLCTATRSVPFECSYNRVFTARYELNLKYSWGSSPYLNS